MSTNMDVGSASYNAAATMTSGAASSGRGSWLEAVAAAWGQALDNQANDIERRANDLTAARESAAAAGATDYKDKPSDVTELTAASLRMSFITSSAHTSLSSLGQALETMARKQ